MEIREKIIRTAKTFENNTEISGNMGFNDKEFQALMEAVGWQKTQAWCAYFVELVWKLAYIQYGEIVRELNLIMSGGAVATIQLVRLPWHHHVNPRSIPKSSSQAPPQALSSQLIPDQP